MVELIKPSCQAKEGAQKLFFYLNNRLNAPLNLKNEHFATHFIRNTPVLALKIGKRRWTCFLGRRVMVMLYIAYLSILSYQGHVRYIRESKSY